MEYFQAPFRNNLYKQMSRICWERNTSSVLEVMEKRFYTELYIGRGRLTKILTGFSKVSKQEAFRITTILNNYSCNKQSVRDVFPECRIGELLNTACMDVPTKQPLSWQQR